MIFNKKYLIITHTYTTGPSQELRDYFIKNKVTFAFLENPFFYNKNQKRSKVSFYQNGKFIKSFGGISLKGPEIFYFLKDFFEILTLTIKLGKKFDICISVDPLNTLSAWFLKKIGFFKKLVFWTIDYTPKRFDNNLLNNIYHSLDRFCCYHSDLLWNSSGRMKRARKENGVDLKKCSKEVIIVDGCHFDDIGRLPDKIINRFRLVFMGHLIPNKGVDLIFLSLPEIVKKYPKSSLTIIGTGPEEKKLKKMVKDLGIEKKVTFTGYVKEYKYVERMIARCGIAVAPYVPDPNSFTFFSDVGKVKIYLACGLPVLITDVPEIAKDIEKNKAGLIFEYNKDSLSKAIKKLVSSQDFYFEARKNAANMAKNLSWDNVFRKVLTKSNKYLWN